MTLETLDKALGTAERVLLDSSSLIAYHSKPEAAHALATHLMDRIEDEMDPLHGYFSVISAAELLIRPHRRGVAEFTFMHTFLRAFRTLWPCPWTWKLRPKQPPFVRSLDCGSPMPSW